MQTEGTVCEQGKRCEPAWPKQRKERGLRGHQKDFEYLRKAENLRRVLRKNECDLFCINTKQFLKLLGREQSVQGHT